MMIMPTTITADRAMNASSWPTFQAFLEGPRRWYRRRRDLREARAAFLHMIHLDHRMLDDAGVTREEVLWAAALPIEINAALALQARATARKKRQPNA